MRLIVRLLTPLVLLLAMLLPAEGATADPAFTQRSVGLEFHVNLCNGELAEVHGFGTFVGKEQMDGTVIFHATFHGQGVGDQGNEYVVNQVAKTFTSLTGEFAVSLRTMLISQGSAPNQAGIIYFDSDGNSRFESDCRG